MRFTLICLLAFAAACAPTQMRLAPTVSYDSSSDITRYSTPWIQLMQRADVTMHSIRFAVMAACEGYHTHCNPRETIWQFESGHQVAQFLLDQELGIHVDGAIHVFETGVYRGHVTDMERSPSPQFRVPLSVLQQVATADNVAIHLGGNAMQFSDRRREALRQFIAAVQGN
jgi:hypothetical protein